MRRPPRRLIRMGSSQRQGPIEANLQSARFGGERESRTKQGHTAGPAVQLHPCAVFAGNDAEPFVLDFMQPQAAGRQFVSLGRKTRLDEAGGIVGGHSNLVRYLGAAVWRIKRRDRVR
jgi:hypothetical protein